MALTDVLPAVGGGGAVLGLLAVLVRLYVKLDTRMTDQLHAADTDFKSEKAARIAAETLLTAAVLRSVAAESALIVKDAQLQAEKETNLRLASRVAELERRLAP